MSGNCGQPSRSKCQRIRLLGLVWLALLLTLSGVAYAQSVTGTTSDGLIYSTSNSQITITGYAGPGGFVNMSGTINVSGTDLPVTSIGNNAFASCTGLTGVTIPGGVISIGNSAFEYCSSLTSVVIPSSVTSIGSMAFLNCSKLTSVTIPSGVTSIRGYAFRGCSSLTIVTIPSSVTSLGGSAFDYTTNLTSITVDPLNTRYSSLDGVLFDKNRTTLLQCPGGKAGNYTVPSTVTSIGSMAFIYCNSLNSVSISNHVSSIGPGAFGQCSAMTSITVDASNPFYSSLDGVLFNKNQTTLLQYPGGKEGNYTVPGSVTNIEWLGFAYSYNLTSVTIPSSVTRIGPGGFNYCNSLTSITVDASNLTYSSLDGVLFDKNKTTLFQYPEARIGSYTIPGSVTSIDSTAFDSCRSLTGIIIPNGVTSLGGSTFNDCRSLSSVTILGNLTTIGGFTNCTSLISITIPNTVTSILPQAFYSCTSLTSVYVPRSVTSIGVMAFYSCSKLSTIMVDESNPAFSSSDGCLFNKNQTALIQCPGSKTGGYTIPSSVTTIGGSAFQSCTNLISVTIPTSVTTVGSSAFQSCSKLESAAFMGNAPSMGSCVFSGVASDFTMYFYNGATGFTTPTWDGYFPVRLGSPPLASWLFFNGLPSNVDLTSTPQFDGVPLLMAYALNLDPSNNQSANIPQPQISGTQMSLTYYSGSPGVGYFVETSTDLQSWSTNGVTITGPDPNNHCTATVPITTGSSCFMRLKVVY